MSHLPSEYGPLMRKLFKYAVTRRQPVYGAFELTSRCNLSCRMCYVRYPPCDHKLMKNELSASEWLIIAHDAIENGMVFLLLTGGEVFLRPDFFQIFEPLTRMGLIITLYTNGTLISENVAERLSKSPPSRTEVTLYGATSATYEAITGIPGSYARCCSGIEALVNHHIPLWLKTTITRQNVSELEAMRQMAHDWGVTLSGSWLLSKRRDGVPSNVEDCRLSATDCVTLEATDRISASELSEAAIRKSSPDNDDSFHCQAGKAAFSISPSGEMNVCIQLPRPAAPMIEIGFRESWEQVQRYVDSAPSAAPKCLACDARVYCQRCPAWSVKETGTLTDPVPYLCEIAHLRKERYEQYS